MHNLSLKPVDAEKHVDIIIVVFNNLELIEYQTLFLKKNIKDNYSHIIVDNSIDKEIRCQLYSYCKDNGIAYVGLLKNWSNKVGPSYSHAIVLNYAYKHIIKKREPYAFGFIDHDLFPIGSLSIINKLDTNLYMDH